MAATAEQTIDLRDVGPIKKLTLPVPAGGGLVVLRAKNGRGKTKALEAVETVLTGRGKVEVRDRALVGQVDAFGVNLRVAKSTRRSGELEVVSLDGKMSAAELVDPGLKSPEAADAKRIKALVTLSGVKPEDMAKQFRDLLGGRSEFETVVRPESLAGDDAVAAADRVKRDIESAARKAEDQAKHAEGRIEANNQAAAGVDLQTECDADLLQRRLEDAVRRESQLKAGRDALAREETTKRQAREALETAKAQYTGPSAESAQAETKKLLREVQTKDAAVAAAQQALTRAKEEQALATSNYEKWHDLAHAANSHQNLVNQWQAEIDKPLDAAANDTEMAAAVDAVTECRKALENAALVRKAQGHLLQAETAKEEAQQHVKLAEQLREAAKGIDEVLSGAVAKLSGVLRVEAGRLVLDTDRGATYFSDLSHGERWKIALDIAIDALGAGIDRGVIVVPQEAFEGLDPENRKLIAEHLRERRVLGLTAEATDDEQITAEVL